jgi:hypothetical protein
MTVMAKVLQHAKDELKPRILALIRESYAKVKELSSGMVRRELGLSNRMLYQLFPKGIEQMYTEAGSRLKGLGLSLP